MKKLLTVLNRLVDAGNTVLVVEHHLDVIKTADWIVDLGPEAGDAGGEIVAEGTPEQVAQIGRVLHRQVPPRSAPQGQRQAEPGAPGSHEGVAGWAPRLAQTSSALR